MRVFLVRHAHAVDEGPSLSDDWRWLSAKGREATRRVARVLGQRGVAFDAVLTSPLVRAVQTAELLADVTGYVGPVEAIGALSPGVPPRVVANELAARGASVAVVGHEPNLSALGAFLTARPSFPPFRKAQVTLVEDGQPGWWLDPDTLVVERLLLA